MGLVRRPGMASSTRNSRLALYMRAFDFALPFKADKVPTGPDRFHDGY